MREFSRTQTVGELVSQHPQLSRIFEDLGIDYCCGGKRSLLEVCSEKRIEVDTLLARLATAVASLDSEAQGPNPATLSLTDLADHIEQEHHTYLRSELPRLDELSAKVLRAHGNKDPRLQAVRENLIALREELFSHLLKEEQILFPMIRQLEASETAPMFHCGSVANPVRQMEYEHDSAGSALQQLRDLTDDYQAPEWACNTYRAMISAMAQLESDLHQHIHKENNVLFPKALEMESEKS